MSEQSESEDTSVSILVPVMSRERMVARKLPLSVLTVAVVMPAPGGPWITGGMVGEGLGVGVGEGVGMGEVWRRERIREKKAMRVDIDI
ncbi:MAG: hypothetical protein UX80_C0003G0052 [Candidatus Amesbacteria bacterium GW2011_GWA2_47_11b]|uniref:Uncharacterized protein n=3 Tax=Candidatus Amesiibacteriota TaxID=1752730 RepID=A0A0G1RMQ4_9BACT|nr:MAG: hypothetical protein UX80_C0003G0052 [Candidatus Amesbacteria bacterium GW2011_GWA2_47_11b]